MMEGWTTALSWVDATGVEWRVCRRYHRPDQQYEACIATKATPDAAWFMRYRMNIRDNGVFEHE